LDYGLHTLRLAIDTHAITSHFAISLLIKTPGGDGGRLGRGLLLIFGRRLRVEAMTAGADRTTRLWRLFFRRDQK
jgi:hypothetical protein